MVNYLDQQLFYFFFIFLVEGNQNSGGEDVMPPSPAVEANAAPQNGVVDLTQDMQVQKALALSMEEHR